MLKTNGQQTESILKKILNHLRNRRPFQRTSPGEGLPRITNYPPDKTQNNREAEPVLVIDPLPQVIITDYYGNSCLFLSARIEGAESPGYKFILEKISSGEVIHKKKVFGLHFQGRRTGINMITWKIFIDPHVYPVGKVYNHLLKISARPGGENRVPLEKRVTLSIGRGGIVLEKAKHKYVYNTDPENADLILEFLSVKEDCSRLITDKAPFLENLISLAAESNRENSGINHHGVNGISDRLIKNIGLYLELDKERPFDDERLLVRCRLKNSREIPGMPADAAADYSARLILYREKAPGRGACRQVASLPFQFIPVPDNCLQETPAIEIQKFKAYLSRQCPSGLQDRWCEILDKLSKYAEIPAGDVACLHKEFRRLTAVMQTTVDNLWKAEAAWENSINKCVLENECFSNLYLKFIIAAYADKVLIINAIAKSLRKFFFRYISISSRQKTIYDFFHYEKESFLTAVYLNVTGEKENFTNKLPGDLYPVAGVALKAFIWIIFNFYREFCKADQNLHYRKWSFERTLWHCLSRALLVSRKKIISGFPGKLSSTEIKEIGKLLFPEIRWNEDQENLIALLSEFWHRK